MCCILYSHVYPWWGSFCTNFFSWAKLWLISIVDICDIHPIHIKKKIDTSRRTHAHFSFVHNFVYSSILGGLIDGRKQKHHTHMHIDDNLYWSIHQSWIDQEWSIVCVCACVCPRKRKSCAIFFIIILWPTTTNETCKIVNQIN